MSDPQLPTNKDRETTSVEELKAVLSVLDNAVWDWAEKLRAEAIESARDDQGRVPLIELAIPLSLRQASSRARTLYEVSNSETPRASQLGKLVPEGEWKCRVVRRPWWNPFGPLYVQWRFEFKVPQEIEGQMIYVFPPPPDEAWVNNG